jgi:thymidylate synthase
MHVQFRNVNDAFIGLVRLFKNRGTHLFVPSVGKALVIPTFKVTPSRVGECLMIEEPVTITYTHPHERVLCNSARDCNPFFHLYEALWMLAGRDDIAPLTYYNSQYAKFVQDGDCPNANGAYGYRWRHARVWRGHEYPAGESSAAGFHMVGHSLDQLDSIVEHLKYLPKSRRAVLQMWNVENDLLNIGYLRDRGSNDVCCNLSVMFSIREHPYNAKIGEPDNGVRYLDMTVTNRSNDMIFGMLGANYVHFTILQEYIAARLDVRVGVYNQITNNLHVYTEKFKPVEWLEAGDDNTNHSYPSIPLVQEVDTFDDDIKLFVEKNKDPENIRNNIFIMYTGQGFLNHVARPMMDAYHFHKLGRPEEALKYAYDIKDPAWGKASLEWLERRG